MMDRSENGVVSNSEGPTEGVFVIGAWVERRHRDEILARITCRPTSIQHGTRPYVMSREQVLLRVADWLDELTQGTTNRDRSTNPDG